MAPYEAWIREQVLGSEPGPAFPTQSPELQSGLPEPTDENCTIALPGEGVQDTWMSAGSGRFEFRWKLPGVQETPSLRPLTPQSAGRPQGQGPGPGKPR